MVSLKNLMKNYLLPFFRARGRKGFIRIVREMVSCYIAYNIVPRHYFLLGLYMDYIENDARDYLPKKIARHYFDIVNNPSHRHVTKDKLLCARALQKVGVPCVDELFAFHVGRGFIGRDEAVLSTNAAHQLVANAGGRAFVKPVGSSQGNGAYILNLDHATLDDIDTVGEDLIFQPVIEQHFVMRNLSPGAASTARVDTLRVDGEVVINAAVLRLGHGERIVDNAAEGGMVVPIDLQTGYLGRYARFKPKHSTARILRHPDTGVAFDSVQIPFWSDVLDMVRIGAQALAPMVSLGWDIAITPDGPVVIETNTTPDLDVYQLCKPLRHTEFGQRALAEWVDRHTITPAPQKA